VTRVAAIQSSYIPWKGYFDIIHDVDLFIFYDDVQYTSRDWRTRNRIKTAAGPAWLTIPAGADRNRLVCDVALEDDRWPEKHWRTLRHAYSRAPFFKRYEEFFRSIYLGSRWESLPAFNQTMTRAIARDLLGIGTTFRDSREYRSEGKKLDKMLDLLGKVSATSYVTGPSAASYIEPERFARAGIDLVYKDYSGYPEYPQLHPPFEHGVSVLDLLFHVGPEAPHYIWGWREGTSPTAAPP
jgi:hypothetical protein